MDIYCHSMANCELYYLPIIDIWHYDIHIEKMQQNL